MLEIKELAIRRGSAENPFNIVLPSLSLNDGEVVALCGSSGCGKSTLLEMIGLILKPHRLSSYQLGNAEHTEQIAEDIHHQQQNKLAKLRAEYFGFMLQSGGLLPFLTVQENIALPCQMLGKAADRQWLDYLISQLQVGQLLHHYPKQLSIGERQRISFIRSLAHHPSILLADEPTAALDPNNADKLFDIIIDLVKKNNISALIVSHDWDLLSERGIRFIHGKVSDNQAVFQE
ncbi:ABC transporter ATP-binding protein [Glaesserella sp.]|uniref:ABC transporter ATP-binding protein n=1 Tax=Glaesserella sp. TaxID=2094731 RepID=UPI0035A168C9